MKYTIYSNFFIKYFDKILKNDVSLYEENENLKKNKESEIVDELPKEIKAEEIEMNKIPIPSNRKFILYF